MDARKTLDDQSVKTSIPDNRRTEDESIEEQSAEDRFQTIDARKTNEWKIILFKNDSRQSMRGTPMDGRSIRK